MSGIGCPQPSTASFERPSATAQRGQSMVEFVGVLPVLMLGALACVQALLIALSLVFAQVAANRAARGETADAARAVLPRAWRARTSVEQRGSRAHVVVRTPALLPGAGSQLRVRASSELSA